MKVQGFDSRPRAGKYPHQGGVHAIGGGSRHEAGDGQEGSRVVHEGGRFPPFRAIRLSVYSLVFVVVIAQHSFDVVFRFLVGNFLDENFNRLVASGRPPSFNGQAARVVARYRGNERAAELANEFAQVPRAQAGVDLGVEQVSHGLDADFVLPREPAPGRGHELHQPPGAGGGDGAGVEGALRPDDGVHQIGVRPSGFPAFDDERIYCFPEFPRQVASARAHRIPEGFVDQVYGAVALARRREGARRLVARVWR